MTKLRTLLGMHGIRWYDASTTYKTRTHFMYEGKHVSVVHGYGTFGNQYGLLEMSIDDKTVFGSLTAEECLLKCAAACAWKGGGKRND